jgi:hypothetical protein
MHHISKGVSPALRVEFALGRVHPSALLACIRISVTIPTFHPARAGKAHRVQKLMMITPVIVVRTHACWRHALQWTSSAHHAGCPYRAHRVPVPHGIRKTLAQNASHGVHSL